MTSARVTGRFGPRIVPLDIGCDTALDPPGASRVSRRSASTRSEIEDHRNERQGTTPTADQRNGR